MNETRLNKYIAESGISSRRQADELISTGQVKINGEVVTMLGSKVSGDDQVLVNNKPVHPDTQKIYLALYKPKGVVSSSSDEFGRKTIIALIPSKARLFSVGRLDKDSEGLILLTNDGEFANGLSHPTQKVTKIYHLNLNGPKSQLEKVVGAFTIGFSIEGRQMKADEIKIISEKREQGIFEVSLHQGYNRQLRKMAAKLGLQVQGLKRIKIGKLDIGNLAPGQSRQVSKEEVIGG